MEAPRLFKTVTLSEGTQIYFYDKSRHVAGDRWYVCLRVEVPIKVNKEFFNGYDNAEEAYREFVNAFGDTYVFSYEKERNFISEKEVQSMLETLLRDFMDNSSDYLERPAWRKMCVLKAYRDWKEKEKLRRLHEQMVRMADQG